MDDFDDDSDDLNENFETPEFQALLTIKSVVRPAYYLPKAIESLEMIGTRQQVSSVWEATSPTVETAGFCTLAVAILTPLDPLELRQTLDAIERHLGNVRGTAENEMLATAEFEIAFYEDLVIDFEDFPIPMPQIRNQPWYALPLAEIAPEYVFPESSETLKDIAATANSVECVQVRSDLVVE